jgi:hypothetical protein
MPRLLGISITQLDNRWLCQITVETADGIINCEAWAFTPGMAATYALRLGGIL